MKPLGSVAAVIGAIREDAAVKRRPSKAAPPPRSNAFGRCTRAMSSSFPIVSGGWTPPGATAQTRLAQEDWEDARDALALREEWINRALADGHQLLATPEDAATRRDRLGALSRKASSDCPMGSAKSSCPRLMRRSSGPSGGAMLRVQAGAASCASRPVHSTAAASSAPWMDARRLTTATPPAPRGSNPRGVRHWPGCTEEAISTTTSPGGTR